MSPRLGLCLGARVAFYRCASVDVGTCRRRPDRARLVLSPETRRDETSGRADRYSRPSLGRGGEQRGVSHDPLPRYDGPGDDGHAVHSHGVRRERGAGRVGPDSGGQGAPSPLLVTRHHDGGNSSMRPDGLPRPACALGYTSAQVLGVLGPDRTARLNRWLDTRSAARPICEGRGNGNHPDRSGPEATCGPHGLVVPAADLETFLDRERP